MPKRKVRIFYSWYINKEDIKCVVIDEVVTSYMFKFVLNSILQPYYRPFVFTLVIKTEGLV